jgi:hypothetical protein
MEHQRRAIQVTDAGALEEDRSRGGRCSESVVADVAVLDRGCEGYVPDAESHDHRPPESPNAPALEPAGTVTRTRLSRTSDVLSTREPSTTMPPPNPVASPPVLLAVAVLPETNEWRIVARTQPEVGLLQSSSPAMTTPPVLA